MKFVPKRIETDQPLTCTVEGSHPLWNFWLYLLGHRIVVLLLLGQLFVGIVAGASSLLVDGLVVSLPMVLIIHF